MYIPTIIYPLYLAGATALIGVIGSSRVHDIGYKYVLCPAIGASCVLVLIGILTNNTSALPHRQYPMYWLPWNSTEQLSHIDEKHPPHYVSVEELPSMDVHNMEMTDVTAEESL